MEIDNRTLENISLFGTAPFTQVNYLLVGGGGGGGIFDRPGGNAGGGGAGGIVANNFITYPLKQIYIVTVGTGGAPGYSGGDNSLTGSNGLNTTIRGALSATALGGGGGGGYAQAGVSGGSGGGAGSDLASYGSVQVGGKGFRGQGNNGGDGRNLPPVQNGASDGIVSGGGGGGPSGAGGNGSQIYSALLSAITASGTSVGVDDGTGTYWIAGGGGATNFNQGSTGGKGGGGDSNGAAVANTGSGGCAVAPYTGDGATGIAIFYYTSPIQLASGGIVTSSGTGDSTVWYHVYKDTEVSTFIL